jgi:hypothetical protein
MLSKVAGMMKAELTRAASMFEAIQGRFLGVLEAYKEKLPGDVTEETAEAAEATAETAEPTTDEEPAVEPQGEPDGEPEGEKE